MFHVKRRETLRPTGIAQAKHGIFQKHVSRETFTRRLELGISKMLTPDGEAGILNLT